MNIALTTALRAIAAAWLGSIALIVATQASAQTYKLKDIEVSRVFATPTVAAAPTGAVYFTLSNRGGTPDRLVGASTPRAKRAELHAMSMAGDVMRMREVEAIDAKPGQTLVMQPGSGNHLMLIGLAAPLKSGDKFPLTLRFEKAGTLSLEVPVEKPGQPTEPQHSHMH